MEPIIESSEEYTDGYTVDSKVKDVIDNPIFGDYGRLIFPVDISIPSTLTLGDVDEILPWYSEVNPNKTVEVVNYMQEMVEAGDTIFYDIYSEEEKMEDPDNGVVLPVQEWQRGLAVMEQMHLVKRIIRHQPQLLFNIQDCQR